MMQRRVGVVFWNETITVDGVEKRLPLRIPLILKLKCLDWYPASNSGLLVFNDDSDIGFRDPEVVEPFLKRWLTEPPQPDVDHLKRYVDEMTVDPDDTINLTSRRRWAEIESRHPTPLHSPALRQLLSQRFAYTHEAAVTEPRNQKVADVLNPREDTRNSASKRPTDKALSAFEIREAERKRLLIRR